MAFEAQPYNALLLAGSLCEAPASLRSRVRLVHAALGERYQLCTAVASKYNRLNGAIRCDAQVGTGRP